MQPNILSAYISIQAQVNELLQTHQFDAVRHLINIMEALTQTPPSRVSLAPEEVKLLSSEGLIPCIKAIRTRTGAGLKEAKDMAEAYATQNHMRRIEGTGNQYTRYVP